MTDNNTEPRNPDFKVIIDEWTNEVLEANALKVSPAQIVMNTRLGLVGQRLIHKAYSLGLDAALQALREKA